jgi:hypothetical protein
MTRNPSKPRIGDTVEHSGYTGVVDWIGSAQFAFIDETAVVKHLGSKSTTDMRVMCLFREEYKIVKRRKVSRAEVKAQIREKKQRKG